MTDRPIIFSAPMIRAVLDGRKSMTRRIAWAHQGAWCKDGLTGKPRYRKLFESDGEGPLLPKIVPTPWQRVRPGDRLWVRETYFRTRDDGVICRADMAEGWRPVVSGGRDGGEPWISSIHMPRWASRLTLVVTATKIERLQDISEDDALAEGCQTGVNPALTARGLYEVLWSSLHGHNSWDANPEVVALSFSVEKINIDALKVAA